MRNGYLAELPQRLADVEALILDADKTSDFEDLYETLYRNVHSMKGSAGTHGLHIISTLCHNLEDQLTEASGDQSKVTADMKNNWLANLDLIEQARQKLEQGEESFADLEESLDSLRRTSPEVKYTALLVEPSAIHAQMCEQVFTEHGVSFSHANDGYAALGRLLSEPFDMLITSMQLPLLNGLAVIGALRLSSSRNKSIKTVLLTSSVDGKYDRRIDPDYVVEKNSEMANMLEKIANKIIDNTG